jgi:sugar lactone lactonase YvrE
MAAEYSQQRIAEVLSADTCPALAGTFVSTLDQIGRPIGLASGDKTLFFTSEDAPAAKYGSLQASEADSGKLTRLDETLSHPSGVAAVAATGPVFVVERDQREVRWPVYQKDSGGWAKHGALGSALIQNALLATFLGIAVDTNGRVYAAGPGGLYVLRQNVGVLGKITLNEPVSGVAIQNRYVYFTAGHELCRIKMRN